MTKEWTDEDEARLQTALNYKSPQSVFGNSAKLGPPTRAVPELCGYCGAETTTTYDHPLRDFVPYQTNPDFRTWVHKRYCSSCAKFLGYIGGKRLRYYLSLSTNQKKFLCKKWPHIEGKAEAFRKKLCDRKRKRKRQSETSTE